MGQRRLAPVCVKVVKPQQCSGEEEIIASSSKRRNVWADTAEQVIRNNVDYAQYEGAIRWGEKEAARTAQLQMDNL